MDKNTLYVIVEGPESIAGDNEAKKKLLARISGVIIAFSDIQRPEKFTVQFTQGDEFKISVVVTNRSSIPVAAFGWLRGAIFADLKEAIPSLEITDITVASGSGN